MSSQHIKIGFSGHETFVCRHFWLKKGYDYIQKGRSFSDDDAVVHLGVGKNMVTAIRFWLKGFNILDREDEKVTELAIYLLEQKDPYLEDNASLWLLHYSIIKNERVFIFNAFFNQFLKEKSEFTKEQLISFLKRKTEEYGARPFSDKTYESDAAVFLRSYHRSDDGKADIEDETSNLLIELNLIRPFLKPTIDGKASQWFRVVRESREEIPREILAFVMLDHFGRQVQSIAFKDLLEGYNSLGNIFCITEKGLEERLKEIADIWSKDFSYNETAGNRVFQIKREINKWSILDKYYG